MPGRSTRSILDVIRQLACLGCQEDDDEIKLLLHQHNGRPMMNMFMGNLFGLNRSTLVLGLHRRMMMAVVVVLLLLMMMIMKTAASRMQFNDRERSPQRG